MLTGLSAFPLTPMNEQTIDEVAFVGLIERLAAAGVDSIGVLGLAGLLAPTGIAVPEAMAGFDIPVMNAVALLCLPICFTGGVISRWEGGVLLAYYLAYTLYLILAATHHDALPVFSVTMLFFALPLTALTLVVLVLQERHRGIRPL